MTQFRPRPPTVDEAVRWLARPLNSREYRQACLAQWGEMGADVDQIKAKFLQQWKGKAK